MSLNLEYSITIPAEGDIDLCRKVHSTIYEFRDKLEKGGYKIQYFNYSPYYSGHESTDIREENAWYKILKDNQEVGSFAVEREGSNFPQSNFPNDLSDFSIAVHGRLRDLKGGVLADSLTYSFEKLKSLLK